MDKEEKAKTKDNKKTSDYFAAVGKRKEAIARIRLFKGNGEFTVNNRPIEKYFLGEKAKVIWEKPFAITNTLGKYYATVKVVGSGKSGQLDAVVHGLSRALNLANSDFRIFLKRAGLLTRDPRVKERRKYGLAQKARKGKQSPKR